MPFLARSDLKRLSGTRTMKPPATPEETATALVGEFERYVMSGALVNPSGGQASETLRIMVASTIAKTTAEERERCAAIADSFTCGGCGMDGKAGAAIRGRTTNTVSRE